MQEPTDDVLNKNTGFLKLLLFAILLTFFC